MNERPSPTGDKTPRPPMFVWVTTRNAIDPDQPADRRRINYHNPQAVEWLRKHTWYSIHNGCSINIAPDDEGAINRTCHPAK